MPRLRISLMRGRETPGRLKVCIVSSVGGHLTEVRALMDAYDAYEVVYVLNDHAQLPADMVGRTHFVVHSERDWRTLTNLWEAYRLLRRERPDVILSTGAGPAVPFSLIGRWLFGTVVVFVETITRVDRPSLTGRLMYRIAHRFYYQHETLARFFPRGEYAGTVL